MLQDGPEWCQSRGMTQEGQFRDPSPGVGFCEENNRLRQEFLKAIHELLAIQAQQTQAVIDNDSDFERFDVLLHMAQERKDHTKYALIAHIESHHCEET
jgi:hypothetical protein